ncbi:MAG: hypothetical protein IJK54_08225 [Clostridia bacterium]|nr:hypothetical protein [Clostridia bacterium]
MIPSLILNILNVVLVAGCVAWGVKKVDPWTRLFRFFTVLSNVLCAIASLAVVVCELCGALPFWALLLKYAGTAAVTVTMLTVLLFLGPTSHDWKGLLSREDLFMHLICPVLAIVSFLVFEKTEMPAWTIAIGALPVPIYGALYMKKVVYSPEERRWEDFYGFNRGGKWPLSVVLMTIAGALIAFALWAI